MGLFKKCKHDIVIESGLCDACYDIRKEIQDLEIEKFSCQETIYQFTKNDGEMNFHRMELIVHPLEKKIVVINKKIKELKMELEQVW